MISTATPDIAEVITTSVHRWMSGYARSHDLDTHIALELQDHCRIHAKTRRQA